MRNAKLKAAAPGGGGSRYTRVELALKSAEQLKGRGLGNHRQICPSALERHVKRVRHVGEVQ